MSINEVVVSGLTGPALPDSTSFQARAGKSGETLTSQLHGKYYSRAIRGQVFIGNTPAAGVAVQKYDGTAPTFVLWNPANSAKNVELLKINVGMMALGTRTVTGLQLQALTGCGSAIGTGLPFSAFAKTPTAVYPATITGYSSSCFFCNAGTVTLTAAGTVFYVLPFSYDNASAGSHPVMTYDFDGTAILPPGTAVYVAGDILAPGSTLGISLIWAEIPV